MTTATMAETVSAEKLSQEVEYRLRSLEGAIMVLLGEKLMTMKKIKMVKEETISDLERAAGEVAFTISNYPLE